MSDHAAIRAQLEESLGELVARAKEIDSDLSTAGSQDWEERATETEDDEVEASMGNLTLKEIDQIKQALYRMDEGTYGICTRCKGEIPPARLEAIPYATTCTSCV